MTEQVNSFLHPQQTGLYLRENERGTDSLTFAVSSNKENQIGTPNATTDTGTRTVSYCP